jgi:hypothetical protein
MEGTENNIAEAGMEGIKSNIAEAERGAWRE